MRLPISEEDLAFGDEFSMDLIWLDGKALLHIVDSTTRFSAATVLDSDGERYSQPVEGVWYAFLQAWINMYTRYQNRSGRDQRYRVTSDRRRQIKKLQDIQFRLSVVKRT